nr:divalent cation tolerance protein CutA [Breoghania sp. L-A4]
MVLVKTVSGRVVDVMEAIGELHPYEKPALLVLPTAGGARDYLEWIVAATQIIPDKPH